MREILLAGIVAALSLIALVRPKIGLYAYVWYALMRPDVLAWAGGGYSFYIALATVLGTLPHLPRLAVWFTNWISLGFILMQIPILLSIFLSTDPGACWPRYNLFARVLLMALLMLVHVQTETDLRSMLLLIAVSLGIIGCKFGLGGILRGGARYGSGYGDTLLSDNNTLALGFVMIIPLCFYARCLVTSRWLKLALLVMTCMTTGAVVFTYSRGGALSLAGVFLVVSWRSNRKFLTLALCLALAAPTLYLVSVPYTERLKSLTGEPDGSIMSRQNLAVATFEMWKDHPWFGVGFGSKVHSRMVSDYLGYQDSHVAHNNYLQIMADTGIFTFGIYALLLGGTIVTLGFSVRRVRRAAPGKEAYPAAIQASLIGFAIGSTFLSRVTFDLLYMVLMCAASWQIVERQLLSNAEVAGQPKEETPGPVSTLAV